MAGSRGEGAMAGSTHAALALCARGQPKHVFDDCPDGSYSQRLAKGGVLCAVCMPRGLQGAGTIGFRV